MMRNSVADKLEQGRTREGQMASDAAYGLTGAFTVIGPNGVVLDIVSSGTDFEFGWEHVSVSARRTPNWGEMCWVKDLFWNEDEVVIQLHPAKANYVNCHPNCLHLWRPLDAEIPLPPTILV